VSEIEIVGHKNSLVISYVFYFSSRKEYWPKTITLKRGLDNKVTNTLIHEHHSDFNVYTAHAQERWYTSDILRGSTHI
jgi:hypothetical protein